MASGTASDGASGRGLAGRLRAALSAPVFSIRRAVREGSEPAAGRDDRARVLTRRYEFHPPGLLYIGLMFVIALGGFQSQNNLLFWVFGVMVASTVLSGVVSGGAMTGLTIARRVLGDTDARPPQGAPADGQPEVGRPVLITYEVTNRNRLFPAFALLIEEERSRDADSAWHTRVALPPGFIAFIGPGQTVRCSVTGVALRRGQARFGPLSVISTFPIGLLKKVVTFEQRERLPVHPVRLPLRPAVARALAPRGLQGSSTVQRLGRGLEFFGLRDYTRGDEARSIAWRRSARLGQLVVKQHALPSPPRVWIAIDPPPALGDDPERRESAGRRSEERERAVALAWSLASEAHALGMAVGLRVPWLGVAIPAAGGARHLLRLRQQLTDLDLDGPRPSSDGPIDGPPDVIGRELVLTVGFGRRRVQGSGPMHSAREGPAVLNVAEPGEWLDPARPAPPVIASPPDVAVRTEPGVFSALFTGRAAGDGASAPDAAAGARA